MSSNLKVNTILPSVGNNIGIGTVGGLINIVGNIDVNSTSGISTFNGLEISGIVTAKAGAAVTYYGDGSNLTGITDNVVTINNNANNRIITGSGTANTLEAESNLTFDGSILSITGNTDINVGTGEADIYATGAGDKFPLRIFNSDTTSTNKIGIYFGPCNNVAGAYIKGVAEADFTSAANRDAGLEFGTRLNATFLAPLKISADGTTIFDPSAGGTLKIGGSSAHTSKIVIADNAGTGNGNCLVEGGDGSDFFTITSAGNIKFASGKGIDFSLTADGSGSGQYELLDDYEEGNWTPTVESGSGSFYVYSAKYTKIGRQVGIQFYMQLNNGAGNTNGVSIGGLPFTVRSNGWTCSKISTGYNNSGIHCRAKAGTSAIDIKGPADQAITFSNINGTWILSSFIYFTDS